MPDQPPKNEQRMSCGEPGAEELARPVRRAGRGNGPAATPPPVRSTFTVIFAAAFSAATNASAKGAPPSKIVSA